MRDPIQQVKTPLAASEAPLRSGRVYTDDDGPAEWLIDKPIVNCAGGSRGRAGKVERWGLAADTGTQLLWTTEGRRNQ